MTYFNIHCYIIIGAVHYLRDGEMLIHNLIFFFLLTYHILFC